MPKKSRHTPVLNGWLLTHRPAFPKRWTCSWPAWIVLPVRSRSANWPERVMADKRKQGERGSSGRLLREIEERLGRFSRVFGERTVSDLEPAETRAWLMDLTTIIQTSRGKEETDEPVSQVTRHAYKRTLSLCFGWAKQHGAAATNPVTDVKLAQPERVLVLDTNSGPPRTPPRSSPRRWRSEAASCRHCAD